MMKRIVMLTTLALMLVAAMALSGVAQAKPISGSPDAKCAKLAIKTLGASFNPSNYTFEGGTEGNNDFTLANTTGADDFFCGLGGDDRIDTLDAGDIFLGGDGDDNVLFNHGTFNGGEGIDSIGERTNFGIGFLGGNTGTFNGGEGNDSVTFNQGTFNGEAGDDSVLLNGGEGTFNGGAGADSVHQNQGTFNGGDGIDSVTTNNGTFNQDAL
jgi:Ca2+-binding RTX toxin-like protein